MGMEDSLFDRRQAREQQGVHDPKKAEAMAFVSADNINIANVYEKDGDYSMAQVLLRSAERQQQLAGVVHDLETLLKSENVTDEQLNVIKSVVEMTLSKGK